MPTHSQNDTAHDPAACQAPLVTWQHPADVPATFKHSLYSRRQHWRTESMVELAELVAGWSPALLGSGELAVWISAKTEFPDHSFIRPWWDVENAAAHGDIGANLAAGRALLRNVYDAGLADGLTVLLSGSGLRFVWDFLPEPELAEAMLLMTQDTPNVDAKPQENGVPLFLAGYRGPKAQGGKPTHMALLARPDDLFTLTPADYAARVAGPADPAEVTEIMRRLVPTRWTPPAWRPILEANRERLELRQNLFSFPRAPQAKTAKRVPWLAIQRHLAGLGIEHRPINWKGSDVLLLDHCPICGRGRRGNEVARVVQSGALRCWRATCPAGADKKGLKLSEWAGELVKEHAATDDDFDDSFFDAGDDGKAVTLDAASQKIREALAGNDDILVRASPGTGKSREAIRHALTKADKSLVLFTCYSKAIAVGAYNTAMGLCDETGAFVPMMVYDGRSEDNCEQADRCEEIGKKGFSPAFIACPSCKSKERCAYRKQLKGFDSGIIFAAHSSAPTILGRKCEKVKLWIVDESPVSAFLRTVRVGDDEIASINARLVNEADIALTAIRRTAEKLIPLVPKGEGEHMRLYCTETPPGEWKNTKKLFDTAGVSEYELEQLDNQIDAYRQFAGEKPMQWQKRLFFDEAISMHALNWLDAAVRKSERRACYVRVANRSNNPISYRVLVNYTPRYAEELGVHWRVVVLDGTGRKEEIDRLFDRDFKVVDASVTPPPARRVWIMQAFGKVKAAYADDNYITERIREAASYLKPTDKSCLIVTHKDLCFRDPEGNNTLEQIAMRVAPHVKWDITWHGAAIGVNDWEAFDACIVLGHSTPRRDQIHDHELFFFGDDMAARESWFEDLPVRAVVQSVGRIRAVRRPKTVIVSSSRWPTSGHETIGPPSLVVDRRRKGGASENVEAAYLRLLPLARQFGLAFVELAAWVGVFRKEDKDLVQEWEEKMRPVMEGKRGAEFVATLLNTILYTVATKSDPHFPPIVFNRRDDWSVLISRLADETGLPEATYRPGHRGRPTAALGTIESVRALWEGLGQTFDPALWGFASPEPAQAPTEEVVEDPVEPATTPTMPSIRPEWATIHRRAIRPWFPPALAAIPVLPPGLPPETYFPPLAQRMVAGMVAV